MALPHNSDRPPRPAVVWVVLPGVKRRLLDGLGGCGAAQNEERESSSHRRATSELPPPLRRQQLWCSVYTFCRMSARSVVRQARQAEACPTY